MVFGVAKTAIAGRSNGGTAEDSRFHDEVRAFAKTSVDYYVRNFSRIDNAAGFTWTVNWAAAGGGPIWMAARRLWVLFWLFLVIETFAVVQVSTGLWADLGAEQFAR